MSDPKRQRLENGQTNNKNKISDLREAEIETWKAEEGISDMMVPLIGKLYRESNIICTLFGKGLVYKSSIDIIKCHNYVCKYGGLHVRPQNTYPILKAIIQIPDIRSMRIDLCRTYELVKDFIQKLKDDEIKENDFQEQLVKHLSNLIVEQTKDSMTNDLMVAPRDVVLYGFGRIGRLLARLLIEKSGAGVKLMLRAIVVRKGSKEDLMKRASLLRRDSVHGPFHGTIRVNEDANALIANGSVIQIIYSNSPDQCDYTKYGINNAVVIDNTGKWRDEKGLSLHLKSPGVSKVILTAPGKGDNIQTIVAGVNDSRITDSVKLFSAASCTTNAIVPCLSAIDKEFGIESGHIETVHSFTNDQNLIDNYHAKERRGRSAVLNMVLTETGAAKAVSNCLPELKGKLTANAIRVPTPNVSLAILMLHLKKENVTANEINSFFSKLSTNSPLQAQIDFVTSTEVASTDFVGSRAASVVDGKATIATGNKVNLYVWYDNEFGYSCQVIRLLQRLCGIIHTHFPRSE